MRSFFTRLTVLLPTRKQMVSLSNEIVGHKNAPLATIAGSIPDRVRIVIKNKRYHCTSLSIGVVYGACK